MKFTILGLIVVGVIAAVAAAVLIAMYRADMMDAGTAAAASTPVDIEILVAANDLPAMSVVDGASIAKKTVRSDMAPEGAASSSVQVVGKIVTVPVVAGQPFVRSLFADEGAGLHLAATLPEGGRAMSILLSEENAIVNMLYAGSLVDVMGSFRLPGRQGGVTGEIVSATLLEGVRVLAVGTQSVVSGASDTPGVQQARRSREHLVTLLVDSRQAEVLQLAMNHGQVSLAMRNPLDRERLTDRGVRLSELSEDIARRLNELAQPDRGQIALAPPQYEGDDAPPVTRLENADETNEDRAVPAAAPLARAEDTLAPADEMSVRWWTTILMRGEASETLLFPSAEPGVRATAKHVDPPLLEDANRKD